MAVAGDLLAKVICGLALDGVKRAYHEIRRGVRRRQTIDVALSGTPSPDDPRLKRAFDDLNILIGAGKGELTESVAAFIREIERSALPEAMVRCALTNEDGRSIFPAFEVIYKSFGSDLPFQCEAFFQAFFAAIKLSLEADVHDPALLEFVQAQHSELSRQLNDVSKALAAIKQLPKPLDLKEILEARLGLARQIEQANRDVPVETLRGIKRCRIRQLVVPPRLTTASATKIETKKAKNQPKDGDTVSFLTFKATARRAIILGDPGGGKSTLTQMLCYDNSHSIILEANYPGKPNIDPTSLRLPLRIVLRSFDKRRQSSPGCGLFDYLVEQSKEVFDGDAVQTARVLRHSLTMGTAIAIFDGLDEILEIESRREMVSLIEMFSSQYAACPTIVTSRLVGYQDAPMSDDFSIYYLSAFNSEEVAAFSHKFIKLVENIKSEDAKKKSEVFLIQTNKIAADLRENPLLLGLMVYLFICRGDVPSNRPEIYKECATLMFEKWDQRRDIIFKIPVDFDLLHLFSFLASRIFGSAETEDGVTRDWIMSELRFFFENWYLDKAKAIHASKSLVEFITGRAWVMYEIGPNVYKFTHRTFLEYFFARNLISSSESVASLFRDSLLSRILKSEWDVVCHLALQTAVFRDSGKMNQAADAISFAIQTGSYPPQDELALLSFVAASFEYLLLPETRYCELVGLITKRTIEIGAQVGVAANKVLISTIANTKKRESIAKEVILRIVRDAILGGGAQERAFAMIVIAKHGASDSLMLDHPIHNARVSLGWRRARANALYFSELRREVEPANRLKAEMSLSDAHSYIYAYRDRYLSLFDRHGWAVFFRDEESRVWLESPSLYLEMLESYLFEHGRSEMRHSSSEVVDYDPDWRLIEKMAAQVVSEEAPCSIRFASVSRSEFEMRIEALVRRICMRVFRGASKGVIVKCSSMLVLIAFAIECFEPPLPKKRKAREGYRFEEVIPPNALDFLFRRLADHGFGGVLRDWNSRRLDFVKKERVA